jgi:autotransporter-associated beta strand protein
LALVVLGSLQAPAVGTWTAVVHPAPNTVDTLLLLSDGTVMAANAGDRNWFLLTPDTKGSYVNGTWRTIASMHDMRLYYASQVLQDGRVFIAGGEYGTGKSTAELYDPLTDRWTYTPLAWQSFSDAISEILPNGNVLIAPVGPIPSGTTIIYSPASNSWRPGAKLFRGSYQDEASWVKLPDDSILTIDPFGTNSERYLPASNTWINDASLPIALYDPYGGELGAGFLLADGRAFFLGSSGHTAFYTPTGTAAPGAWTRGPDLPDSQGTPDAPAAMMVNGKILCLTSPIPTSTNHFPAPATFYEYDPIANSFTLLAFPSSLSSVQPFVARMLDLPDGSVLLSESSRQLYVYFPDGAPLAAGKPTITSLTQNNDGSYHLIGTLLNGISEGAAYGDDAQMRSSYPLVRLTNSSGGVIYGRTFNWSSTSIMTGNRQLSTEFTLPGNLIPGNYYLVVSANGNASDPITFATTIWNGTPNGNWDMSTINWLKSSSGANYNEGDFVVFADIAAGSTNVTLTTTLTPGSIFVRAAQTGYTFAGPGRLSGAGRLIMNGLSTLTLSESGGDDFTGGIAVNSGTLVLDTLNSSSSGGMTIASGATVVIGRGGIPLGSITNNGQIIFNQAGDSVLANAISGLGVLTKSNANKLTVTSSNTWSGSTLVMAGTLELAGIGSIAGTTNITVVLGAALAVANRIDGLLTLMRGQTLQGNGTLAGSLLTLPESAVMPAQDSLLVGAWSVLGNATLQGALYMKVDAAGATNDSLHASAINYGGILVLTNISSASLSVSNVFRLFAATNFSGAFSAILPAIPAPGLAWNTNNLLKDGSLGVMFAPGLTWSGANDRNWDFATANWSSGGNPTNYVEGAQVAFDDSVTGSANVVLTQPVLPGKLVFNNSYSNYILSGTGSLTITNGLMKDLPGTVRLAETGGDKLSGGLNLSNGTLILDNTFTALSGNAAIGSGATLQLGLNDTNGSLPPGTLLLNGRLILDRTDNLTVSAPIAGLGMLIKSNHNLVRIFQNNVNWTGAVRVAQGTLQIGTINALGKGTNVSITVSDGAALDLNGVNGTNAVTVSGTGPDGKGAIINNSIASASPGLAFLHLAGNTTIGGLNGWDLRPAGGSPDIAGTTFAGLSTGGQPFTLTKIGPNVIGIVSANIDPSLTFINVQSGTLVLEGDLPTLGNTNTPLTVSSNAILEFRNLGAPLTKNIVLDDGATILNTAGINSLVGPLTLNTNSAGTGGNGIFNIGASYLWMNGGTVGGPGNLIKTGSATLRLSGFNTYKGNTLINAGILSLWGSGSIRATTEINIAPGATLKADDRADKTLALTAGQTLRGNGMLSGILVVGPASTVSPGPNASAIGSLTVSSNVTLQGTAAMKLNPAFDESDFLRGNLITYGGTLALTNVSTAPFAAGNSFHLFSATNYTGSFTNISPPRPGPGLQWDTNRLVVNGTLGVVPLPSPAIVNFAVAGFDLVIYATNGVAGSLCSVMTSTNLAMPLTQWTIASINRLRSSGNFTVIATNSVDPAAPQRFYTLQVE